MEEESQEKEEEEEEEEEVTRKPRVMSAHFAARSKNGVGSGGGGART
jgi:hypothetical protein